MAMPQTQELVQQAGDPELAKILVHIPGIALVLLGFAFAFWAVYWDYRRQALEFAERRLMIERGLTPPPYIPRRSRVFADKLNLGMGMFLTFLGIGLALAALIVPTAGAETNSKLDPSLLLAATVTVSLGIGQIAYYYLSRREMVSDLAGRDPGPLS